jgi:hypothetical protein
MFGKYNGFVSKARVSACMHVHVFSSYSAVITARRKLRIALSIMFSLEVR